jgi:hypothetical protein
MGILALEFTAGCSYIQVTDNTPQSGQEENWNNDLNYFAEVMSQLHEEVRKQRGKDEKVRADARTAVTVKAGDLVWVYMRTEKFPTERKGKFKNQKVRKKLE